MDRTVKLSHDSDLKVSRGYVLAFVPTYSFTKHLRALQWQTPFQNICNAWIKDHLQFKTDSYYLIL